MRRSHLPTIRRELFLLILAILIPIFAVESFVYCKRFERRRHEEMQANTEVARAISRTFSQFMENVLHQELATGIALTRSRYTTAEQNRFLAEDRAEHPALGYIHWLDHRGRITASSEPSAVGTNRVWRPYFKEIAAGRPWVLSELYISRITGKPVFAIVRGIPGQKGELLGLIVAAVDPERLDGALAFERGPGGSITIIDRYGRAVYQYPKAEWTWEDRNLLKKCPIISNALAGHETASVTLRAINNQKGILAVTPIPSTGWAVAASRSEKEVLKPITNLLLRQAGLFLLVVAGSLAGALLLSRRVILPIEKLREQVRAFGRGQMPNGSEIGGSVELNELDRSFREMARETRFREESLDMLRRENEAILNSAGEGIFGVDLDGKTKFVNPAAAEKLGYGIEELIGRKSHPLIHHTKVDGISCPEDECFIAMTYRDNAPRTMEDIFWKKNGESFPVEYTSTPLREDGRITGAVITFRDITERKQAEELLRESEAKYSMLVQRANDVVYIVQDETIRFINQSFADLCGYTAEEIEGRSIYDVIAPESRDETRAKYCKCLTGELIPSTFETRTVCKDGVVKDVEVSVAAIQYQGRPAIMGIMRDITERKRTEQALLRMDKLESVGLLAGGIAHDFNNFLTGILGNISLAKLDPGLDKRTFEILTGAENATLRATDLAKQLLTLARGGAPIKKIVHISKLLYDTASFALRGSNVSCRFSLADDLWPVEIDEGQLGQAISNLIVNAQQAMPQGGTVDVTADNLILIDDEHPPLKGGRYIRITIEDHGTGMSENLLGKVFDPYFSTKDKGRGLGLTIVHSIIEKHNGHIEVESRLGVGTTFRIYLPAVEEALKGQAAKPAGRGKKDKADKVRVLIMEDNESVRNVAGGILKYFGYGVSFADNAKEAIKEYKHARESGEPFDAVILDLTIPGGIGGKEVMKQLHEIDPEVTGIVSSGYSDDPVMAHFRDYGFKGSISKPYDVEEMKKILDEVVAG